MTNGWRGDRAAAGEPVKTMPTQLETEGSLANDVTHRDRRGLLVTADGLPESISGIVLCRWTPAPGGSPARAAH